MRLPRWSPPLRGIPLRIVAWLVSFDLVRDLILRQVRRDSRITELPELP
jgi:hypothetical protein